MDHASAPAPISRPFTALEGCQPSGLHPCPRAAAPVGSEQKCQLAHEAVRGSRGGFRGAVGSGGEANAVEGAGSAAEGRRVALGLHDPGSSSVPARADSRGGATALHASTPRGAAARAGDLGVSDPEVRDARARARRGSLYEPPKPKPGAALIDFAQRVGLPKELNVVYAVRAATGEVKFGMTGNLYRRFQTLQAVSPVRLECAGWFEGGTVEEGWLHGEFHSARLHGEWFRPTSEVQAMAADFTRTRLLALVEQAITDGRAARGGPR